MPVPEPLYIDEVETVLGAPGIVSSFLEGTHIAAPDNAGDVGEYSSVTIGADVEEGGA